jgi:hypothetical protein
MKHTLSIALAVLLLALPALAQDEPRPLVDLATTVDHRNTFRHSFSLAEDSELTMTVSLASLANGRKPMIRLRIMELREDGRRVEVRRYRVEAERDLPETSGTLELDAGRYEAEIYVEQADVFVRMVHKD